MGTLTANLHLMMNTFYKPTSSRHKILCEAKAFPSDQVNLRLQSDSLSSRASGAQYAFASQAIAHGLDPKQAVVELSPRPGEFYLRNDDILGAIKEHGESIALVIFPGIQYYTGQAFDMHAITDAAHSQVVDSSTAFPMVLTQYQGAVCAWDLAHGAGNLELHLHDWDVDFAVWCSYKYLNGGPGAIAGLFVHKNWDEKERPR